MTEVPRPQGPGRDEGPTVIASRLQAGAAICMLPTNQRYLAQFNDF